MLFRQIIEQPTLASTLVCAEADFSIQIHQGPITKERQSAGLHRTHHLIPLGKVGG